ncbi:AAA family ATPase [Microbacterium panaciterrae]|uniref:NadR/Ttd14 AAA domain-containing protein n=1 Tax=Microbacterium panaciterrae TaxID=985759 RepID=A0ABP8P495_9MICO
MRIVVSGTHATGKSTLISDFALAHPEFAVLPDPFELVDETTGSGAGSFVAQLRISAERLLAPASRRAVIAERGPLDFLAYLDALDALGRSSAAAGLLRREAPLAARAMAGVDLIVLLGGDQRIAVPDDEDPELREAMAASLLELADDEDLTGAASVIELHGDPAQRLAGLEAAVAALEG